MNIPDRIDGFLPPRGPKVHARESLPRGDGDAGGSLGSGATGHVLYLPRGSEEIQRVREEAFSRQEEQGLEFSLYELITIVEELRWFPPKRTTWAGKRATVGGFSHQTRKVRNFVHPGVRAGERSDPLKFTKGLYGVVYEIAEVANSWLLHRVEKNLLKAMKKEEKKKTMITVATSAPLNPSLFSSITPAKSRPQSRTRLAGILSA